MPVITVDLLQMSLVAALMLLSVRTLIFHLRSSDKDLVLFASRWLNLWSGGGVVLLLLEAIEAAIGTS